VIDVAPASSLGHTLGQFSLQNLKLTQIKITGRSRIPLMSGGKLVISAVLFCTFLTVGEIEMTFPGLGESEARWEK